MTNASELKDLYQNNGFFWNSSMEALVKEFGGREISYPANRAGLIFDASFCDPADINLGYKHYEYIAEYLGEKVAIVGTCECAEIQLFLTESGGLIGYTDNIWMRWGNENDLWRESVGKLLSGDHPIVFDRSE